MKKVFHYFASMSRLKKCILSLFVFIALCIGSLSVILSTHAGSRWVILHAAQLADVRIGDIKGDLLTGLDIASLDVEKNEFQLHAEKITLRWLPLALFYTSVTVQSFTAENIIIHLPPASPEEDKQPENYKWPSLAQPVRINLNNIWLRNITIQRGEQTTVLDTVSGSLGLGTFHLRAANLLVSNPTFSVLTNGSLGLRYPYTMNIKTHWTFTAAADMKMEGEATIDGDIKTINLQHNLQQPLLLATSGTISPALYDKTKKPSVDLVSDWSEQDIPAMFMQNSTVQEKVPFLKSLLTMQGHLQLQGWLDNYQLQGNMVSNTTEDKFSAQVKLNGAYVTDKDSKYPIIKWHIENVNLNSKPLDSMANVPAENENSFLHMKGDISLSPRLQWDILLEGQHVNVGQVFAEWPTDLHIHVASQGEFSKEQDFSLANSRIAINQLNIQGDVRGIKLSSAGTIDFDGSHWQTSDINLSFGANQLSLKGKAGNDVAVEWKINAPLLNQIDPNLKGSIVSSGMLNADIINRNPSQAKMHMTLEVNQFAWHDYAINSLTSELKSTSGNNYQLTLNADNVEIQSQRMANIHLSGVGTIEQHHLSGTINAPAYGVLDFNLDSGWKENQWRGEWQKLSLAVKNIPRWSLATSAPMLADKTQVELNKLCLTTESNDEAVTPSSTGTDEKLKTNIAETVLKNAAAIVKSGTVTPQKIIAEKQTPSICANLNWKADSGFTSSINAIAVPLRQAAAWLKPGVGLDGVLDAQFSLQRHNNNPLAAEFHMQSRNAQFVYQFRGGNTDVYPIKHGTVDVTVKNNQLNSAFLMDWAQYGIINADIKYFLTDKKLQGKVTASLPDLSPLESLLPALDDIHGAATAAINIAGTSEKPDITGNLLLSNGSANVPKLDLQLKDISLDINSQTSDLITMNGQVLSGDGRLMLKGTLTNVGMANWHCRGNIFGANISVIKQSQLSATISPNLTFTADAGAIHLNGSTEIPWARAAIKELPSSATRISKDVVIIESDDDSSLPGQEKSVIPFYTNVILYFGDDVHFNGFGLDGRLSGKINVLKEENRQMLTTGFVAVNNGVYKAYGQELTIERGRLIFQGPYDNPGLDIRAVRTIDGANLGEETKAGLDIAGTLQHPKSTVFSIPAMDDSKAMVLLLTGKPVDQLKSSDAYSLIAAISSSGVEGGSSITSDITRFFGIDEISIKDDKNLDKNVDQSALWIGKNITPRLTIRYIVGLLNQAFSLGMSYKITDKVRVEAESGKKQSIDVIYKIER